jgi:uncharacterized protein YjdB
MASVITSNDFSNLESSAKEAGLKCRNLPDNKTEFYSGNVNKVESWYNSIKNTNNATFQLIKASTHLNHKINNHSETLKPAARTRPWFNMREITSIYNIPAPIVTPVTVGVVSFGGGLYGSVDENGVLTNGDVQAYWTSIGIHPSNHPKVIIKPIDGASNIPNINDNGATVENTIDVETVGGACPSPLLTIILYIGPNNLSEFVNMFSYIYNTPVSVNGTNYKPSIVSCSWGAPEIYYSSGLLTNISNILLAMTNSGMNICTATGDYGSNNGVGGSPKDTYVDFPSSCPYVTAVGGTSLVSPNNIYDVFTSETSWSSGGGGISRFFTKPSYQNAITASGRCTPDIAAVADPNTGVVFIINSKEYVIGGTSVSAPIIAGYLASINCTVFINPRLYSVSSNCYNDIKTGSNGEYSARSGYDNCTGLGTINGTYLSAALYYVYATSISVNPGSLTLYVNETFPLVVTINAPNTTIKSVTWSSANTAIATVSAGIVRGIAPGVTDITVSTFDGSKLSITVRITIIPVEISIPVTAVSLNTAIHTFHPLNTYQLVATVSPVNATNKRLIWTSNSPYATVSPTGLVTAVSLGTASITVITESGNFLARASFNITPPVTSISLSSTSVNISVGQTHKLTATVLPNIAPNKLVNWTTSNATFATVSNNGLVTGIANGTVIITATTVDMGLTATAIVTITTAVQRVSLNIEKLSLFTNQTFQAIATVIPSNASNKIVSWASSNSSIATVDSNGLIRGIANGLANISVLTQDGAKTASIAVGVTTRVTGVTIQPTLSLRKGESFTLVSTVFPESASNKNLLWITNNVSVATVNSKGTVKGIKVGSATITVRTVDGNFMSMCNVTVT